ncbi:UNVERIFIED_ORG: TIGR02611 family protein [Bacillus sp. AZ43]
MPPEGSGEPSRRVRVTPVTHEARGVGRCRGVPAVRGSQTGRRTVGSGRQAPPRGGARCDRAGDQLSEQGTAAPAGHAHRESPEERRARYDADEVHSLRERVAATRWRRRLAARRSVNHGYRVGVGIVGGLITALGLATIPLPGPGWLTVIAGLFVLATEFTWAERLLEFTKKHVKRWTDWVSAQPVWVRLLIAAATAAFVYGVLVVTLHVMGVPDWVPGWVPLWR